MRFVPFSLLEDRKEVLEEMEECDLYGEEWSLE
jgi:hypothetical protein